MTKVNGDPFDDFTVTFDEAVPVGASFKIVSARLHERQIAVTKGGAISAQELEKELSKQGSVIEELRRDVDRTVKGEYGLPTPKVAAIPAAHFWISDEDGNMVDGGTAGDISGAEGFAAEAKAARDVAVAAKADAETAADAAASSATDATGNASAAAGSAGAAAGSATAAGNAETIAVAARDVAVAAKDDAETAAVAAAGSATSADNSATAAGASETSAADSASSASSSADAAETAETGAINARDSLLNQRLRDTTSLIEDPIFALGPSHDYWSIVDGRATWNAFENDPQPNPGMAFAGDWCLVIGKNEGVPKGAQFTHKQVRATPQGLYRLNVTAMRTSAAYELVAYVNFYDADNNLTQESLVFPADQTAYVYTTRTKVVTAPDGTVRMNSGVFVRTADNGKVGFWRVGMLDISRDTPQESGGSSLVLATQAEAEAGTNNTKAMSPLRTWQQALIHRNYQDLVRDYGAVINDVGSSVNSALTNAFGNIAGGGKKKLYLPAGTYRINVNSTILAVPEGLEMFGDGPSTELHIVCSTGGTKTLFSVLQNDVTFRDMKVKVLTNSSAATVILWGLGGGKSNFTCWTDVDGGCAHVNPVPDDTLNWPTFILYRFDSAFEGIHVDYATWENFARAYLNNHLFLNAVTRRVRFSSKFYMKNMYREAIAINAPDVLAEDFLFEGGTSENNWFREYPGGHLAIGNSKGTRIKGWRFKGTGAPIHVEESAVGAVIEGNEAVLTSQGAKFLRFYSNNVGGANVSPEDIVVKGNRAMHQGRTAGSRGIEFGNTGLGPAAKEGVVSDNIMTNFERGYDFAGAPENVLVHHNVAKDCIVGYRLNSGAPSATLKNLQTFNRAVDCTTGYHDAGGGAAPWGTGNT